MYTGDSRSKRDKREQEVEMYEEENFVRLMQSKKEKNRAKRRQLESDIFKDWEDFGEIADIDVDKSKAAHRTIAQVSSKKRSVAVMDEGDVDVPRRKDKYRAVDGPSNGDLNPKKQGGRVGKFGKFRGKGQFKRGKQN